MTAKTRLTLEQLRDRAKQRIARFKTNGRDDMAAAIEAVADLLRTSFTYRERAEKAEADKGADPDAAARLARMQAELDEAEAENLRLTELVPPSGAIVLSGDDAKNHTAVKELLAGAKLADPAALKTFFEKAGQLETEVTMTRAEKLFSEAGEAMAKATGQKWKPTVIRDLTKLHGLHLELREATVKKRDAKGKELAETDVVKVPFVRSAAKADEQFVRLDEWVPKNAKDYLAALPDVPEGSTSTSTTSGVRIPAQPGDGAAPKPGTQAEGYMKRAYASPSELRSKQTTGGTAQ